MAKGILGGANFGLKGGGFIGDPGGFPASRKKPDKTNCKLFICVVLFTLILLSILLFFYL